MNASRNTYSLGLSALLLFGACGTPAEHDNGVADHKAMMVADSTAKAQLMAQEDIVRALYASFNTGDLSKLSDHATEDMVSHQMDISIKTAGLQAVRDQLAMYRTAFPDLRQEILSMSTSGDRTFVQLRIQGTNSGAWGKMPPTGRSMDVMGIDMVRFENGKVVEHWGYMEEMKMMQQLGLVPAPGEAPKKK